MNNPPVQTNQDQPAYVQKLLELAKDPDTRRYDLTKQDEREIWLKDTASPYRPQKAS